ncbi:MAG: hypothetical protein IKU94_10225, partial [Bacteroidaceae bacterium]|nr:hypothetical protein [Bacteroidaceae bacterium]
LSELVIPMRIANALQTQKHEIVGTQRAASAMAVKDICPPDAARSVPTSCSDTDNPLPTTAALQIRQNM